MNVCWSGRNNGIYPYRIYTLGKLIFNFSSFTMEGPTWHHIYAVGISLDLRDRAGRGREGRQTGRPGAQTSGESEKRRKMSDLISSCCRFHLLGPP